MLDLYIALMTKAILENDNVARQQADELSYDFEAEEMEYCHNQIALNTESHSH